jgi:hypothetical protein
MYSLGLRYPTAFNRHIALYHSVLCCLVLHYIVLYGVVKANPRLHYSYRLVYRKLC